MNPNKTAIILVDDDNDFLSEGGKLYDAVKESLQSNHVITNINKLINNARNLGVTIIHVPIVFSANFHEMGEEPYGIFKVVKDSGAFQRDTWGAKVADTLDVHDNDIIVDNKSATCAFATTNLDQILVDNDITNIALGGLLTNICIETTMRTAYDKGYKVYGLTDCSAAINKTQQETSINNNWPLLSIPLSHKELLQQLKPAL